MTHIFHDLPTLETARLRLRKLTLDDAEAMFAYASDPEIARYTTWSPHGSVAASREFLHHVIGLYEQGQPAPWGLCTRADDLLVGTCGFLDWSPDDARAEIGYALARPLWGRGLVVEAMQPVLRLGFGALELNRVQALCDSDNAASRRVLAKLGMRHEGTMRQYTRSGGSYRDVEVHALLRQAYGAAG